MKKKLYNLITLYYNEKGKEEVSLFGINSTNLFSAKSKLKKDLYNRGKIYKKSILLENIENVSYDTKWSDSKKLRFTELFKIGLERGNNISILNAILFVYKQMFDPLIYLIYLRLQQGEKLSEVLAKFPNIFDGFYVNIIKSYFEKSGDQSGGLEEIENFYKKRLELKSKIISSSTTSLISIGVALLSAIILDAVSYPSLKIQYQGFPLPSMIEIIHNIILFFKEKFFVIILLVLLFYQLFKVINLEKIMLFWGKLLLYIPIIGKLIKIEIELLFINMYTAMEKAYLTPSQILNIIADSINNRYIKGLIKSMRKDLLNEGKSLGELMDSKYRFFSEDIIITFQSDDIKKELLKLKQNYVKISEETLGKTVKLLSTILMFASMIIGGTIVVSYMMGTMGVNDIVKRSVEQNL